MPKRIKILFTIPNFDTAGSGKVVHDLVKGLDKNLFEPEICCIHNKGAYFKTIQQLGVKIHLFSFTAAYRPFLTLPFRVMKIYMFFRKNSFDMIHSWHWSSDFTEPLAAKLAGIPYVYTKKAMGWGNKAWTWRSKLSTKIITINEDMVTEYYSGMLHKIEKIPLGIDIKMFNPKHEFKLKRADLNLEKTDFVIVTVANLVAVKGIEILIRAFRELNDPNYKLIIVGDHNNTYGNALRSEFENESIQFIGKKMDVRPYLAIADVFVIPTKDKGEGLPIAPLEAMAFQRIILGSNVPGIKDILKLFPELLFEAGNFNELKDRLIKIINMSIEERNALGLKMAEHVQSTYNVEQFVEYHEELYKRMTS